MRIKYNIFVLNIIRKYAQLLLILSLIIQDIMVLIDFIVRIFIQ